MLNLPSGTEFDPSHIDDRPAGRLVARGVVDRDLKRVFGAGGQVVGVLLNSVSEDADIWVVPGDRLLELHQQELAVDARIGLSDDVSGKDDAGVALGRLSLREDAPDAAHEPAATLPCKVVALSPSAATAHGGLFYISQSDPRNSARATTRVAATRSLCPSPQQPRVANCSNQTSSGCVLRDCKQMKE